MWDSERFVKSETFGTFSVIEKGNEMKKEKVSQILVNVRKIGITDQFVKTLKILTLKMTVNFQTSFNQLYK